LIEEADLSLPTPHGRADLVGSVAAPPIAAADRGGLSEATRLFQIDYIRRQLAAAGGNMSEAAQRLGLHRTNLYRKMRQLGMEADGLERD
jgi:DNA-binding NtrC family response regulator